MSERLTIATVPYANAAILVDRLAEAFPDVTVCAAPPARLREKLLDGSADIALVPTFDSLFDPRLAPVGQCGIVADGAVESVLLKSRVPLAEIRAIRLDPASRTSNALCALLAREDWRIPFVPAAAGAPADAEIVIGDAALTRPACGHDRDLAADWRALTGLPFVFARWTCRAGNARAAAAGPRLDAALRAGLADAPRIAAGQAARLGIDVDRCLRYITRTIQYRIGPREEESLATFKARLVMAGLAAGFPEPGQGTTE